MTGPQIQPATHLGIDPTLCGEVVTLAPGRAEARLTTLASMAVDASGLVHGGFVFGLADHAAMLAVNDPNVVLGAASTRFLKPVRAGDVLLARATCTTESGRRRIVAVEVVRGDEPVMTGELTCFVLDRHVLADMSPPPERP
ncbi:MAG TPA: PaaI family thioesterase [Nannocystis sp.]